MREAMEAVRPKPYNGRRGIHWLEFEKSWGEYLDMLTQSGMNDSAILTVFKGLLDPGSRREIEERQERQPGTTYAQCFQMLRRNMLDNVAQQMRQAWLRVELRQKGPPLTLRD